MKLVSRLAIVLVVCLSAIALPAAPAQANGARITLSPSSGVPGEEVTVRGYNLTADVWVDIYYYLNGSRIWIDDVETDEDGDFPSVTFEVPESYTGAHKVRAEMTGIIYADASFTVKPGLTVTPQEGPVDSTVIVTGWGFAESETGIEVRYYVNGDYETVAENIRANARGTWEADFKIPASTSGAHKIDARGTRSSFAAVEDATFEVTPGIRADRLAASPGESITVTGGGFAANERNIKMLFAGEPVGPGIRANDRGYWQEPFPVPEMPRGTYIVTAEGDFTKKADVAESIFGIVPGIVLSPKEGHVGTNVTALGRGFAANTDVDIMYEDDNVATATTDEKGSFEVTFAVPDSKHGARHVSAEEEGTGIKTEQPAIFTVESDPPPTPELISPRDGRRVGFAGKVRPRFEWSEVEDVSGVYYDLQISASANITDAGDLVAPLVTRDRLVGSNYTLEKADALPHGTYYWIVRAVDGAENAGNWTAVYSFRAGRLPMWAFIVIIVLAVLGGATAVYFYVIKRRMYL